MKTILTVLLFTLSGMAVFSQGDISKEFQYPNFVKYHKVAQERMSEKSYFKAESSIKAAKQAAKSLIKKGFQAEIQSELDELDGFLAQIKGGREGAGDLKKNMFTVRHWLQDLGSVYNMRLSSENAINNGNGLAPAFNRNEVLAAIKKLKASPEYAATPARSAPPKPTSKAEMYRQQKMARSSSTPSSDGPINRAAIDKLEKYITDVYATAIDYGVLVEMGKKISELENERNESDFDKNFDYLKRLVALFSKIDPASEYISCLKQAVSDLDKEAILSATKRFYDAKASDGTLSSLPKSAQNNSELEDKILAIPYLTSMGGQINNALFVDSDWQLERDGDGNNFRRNLKIWLTCTQDAPYLGNPCWAKEMTIVQYHTGHGWGKLMKGDFTGKKMKVDCGVVGDLYAKRGKIKLPFAAVNDAALSRKMLSAVNKYGTKGQTATTAILTGGKGWGINKDRNGRIISRTRTTAITFKDSEGRCHYEYFMAKENYNGSSYGSTYINESISPRRRISCDQIK